MMKIKNHVGIILTIVVSLSLLIPATLAFSVSETEVTGYYLATFDQLPDTGTKNAVESTGVEILDYMNDGKYLIRYTGSVSDNYLLKYYTSNIEAFSPSMKIGNELLEMSGNANIRVEIHDGADMASAINSIVQSGGSIIKTHDEGMPYVQCSIDLVNLNTLAQVMDIKGIFYDYEPQTFMNVITDEVYMGHDAPQLGGYRGGGMLAEVQDNGIDMDHPDFAPILYTDGNPGDGDHGSCTAGIVFADGSNLITAQGIAYESVGVFADYSTGRSTTVANLWNGNFDQVSSVSEGIVQSNSWGSGNLDGTYTTYSAEDDTSANNYPKLLTLWALGNANDGTGTGLITQDSTAKNVLGVGGIYHQNTANMADDQYENNGAGNSPSLGPAADGRQKPDLCAPFDAIYTTDSVDGDGENGYVTGNYYSGFGGTSGATPIVAGSAILAYDMYQDNYFDNNPTNQLPYSSTVKALLIANAAQYPLSDATRNCQGWGVPDMENMYNLGALYHQIHEYPQPLNSGDTWTQKVYTDAANPLKISLVWNDPAAPSTTGSSRALRNNLDLKVVSPGGVTYYGNNGLWNSLYSISGTGVNQWSTSSSYRDDLNNVENVFIQTPQAGLWTIEVSARTGDIAIGPQDFSLVASGGMIPVTSQGIVNFDSESYLAEDSVGIELGDRDLNGNPSFVDTASVNVDSTAEPAGESVLLTETGINTGIFTGTLTISATNGAGILQVNLVDTITVTYIDADDGSGSPAVATDTASVDSYAAPPSGLTVEHFGPTSSSSTETRYMRGITDEVTENGLTAYSLSTTQSSTYDEYSPGSRGSFTVGFRAWIRTSGGVETEITPGTAQGIVVRSVPGTGVYSASWSCPDTSMNVDDTVVIRLYSNLFSPPTSLAGEFTTEPIGATNLDASTWTVSYWMTRANPDWLRWGDATYDSKIENFKWSSNADPTMHNMVNWTRSSDDGTGANDISHYNVYRSDVQTGPWDGAHLIDTVTATGVMSYSVTDMFKGQADATLWWYVVRAVDLLSNEDSNTNAVQEGGGPVLLPYDIDLVGFGSGDWTFISFPYPASGNIESILDDSIEGDGQTTWDVAKWYNPLDAADPWKTHRIGSSINDLATVDETMGVWIHLTSNTGDQKLTLNQAGDYSASTINIPLYTGWNLVGYPSATNRIASTTLPAQANLVAYYNGGAAYLVTDAVPGLVVMSEGNAYWVHVTSDTTWSVAP